MCLVGRVELDSQLIYELQLRKGLADKLVEWGMEAAVLYLVQAEKHWCRLFLCCFASRCTCCRVKFTLMWLKPAIVGVLVST